MDLATLTVNPTIDVAYQVDMLAPVHKMRATQERHDPGGGGVNVARVFVRLGGNARCHYLAGGATGVALDNLLDLHQLVKVKTPIAGDTRVSSTVFEKTSGQEFRVVPEGPEIQRAEWEACLGGLTQRHCDYLVASGSLARGMPDDFYARAARLARSQDIRFVLDSSGRGLVGGLEGGDIFLVKPSQEELEALAGRPLASDMDIEGEALRIVERGQARFVAVTLGERGAMLVSQDGVRRLPAIDVRPVSTVGAGDSFLAAMVHALAAGRQIDEAFAFGVAAGAAAVSTPGTDLARADEIKRFFAEMPDAEIGTSS